MSPSTTVLDRIDESPTRVDPTPFDATDPTGGRADVVAGSPASDPLLPVVGGALRVPLLGGGTTRFVNLDYGATAPAAQYVADRVAQVLPFSGSVHRGAGFTSQASSALYEAARSTVGAALGTRDDDLVVFTRNTTDATNLLARAVPAGAGGVVALDIEHHANLLPWQRTVGLRVVEHAATIRETLARIEAAVSARPTALLAITGASNVTGELLPIAEAVRIAHAHGARVFVDAAQLAPHRAVSLVDLGADYVALSGHKLYAPYGSGVLAGRRDWLDAADPYLAGGGAVREVTVARTDWAAGAARHEGGTPNLVGAVAIAAAFEALGSLVGDDAVDAREVHERALRQRVIDGIAGLPGVNVIRIWDDSVDAIGVVTFTVDGFAPGHVGAYLSAEHGIGVRDGRFCAHPLLARFGLPQGALRASFGVGSRLADADRLVDAIRQLVDRGPTFAYCEGPAGWVPEHDTRDLAAWVGLDLGLPAITPGARPCSFG
ncbi:MAG: aminotransferase class V-fold PLP-dependent enzyme [Solirubrobacteraceae bacterium]|nr:aminotransferase class V-fold PLP-dependent enzyme [Solirubrobacteraceae bacterium]